jgi:hypothetical protein
VSELERIVVTMTNSALATGEENASLSIKNQIQHTVTRINEVLHDNFRLKQEIACEKKRYLDLLSAFLEVRNEQKLDPTEISDSSCIFEPPSVNSPGAHSHSHSHSISGVAGRRSDLSSQQKWNDEKLRM